MNNKRRRLALIELLSNPYIEVEDYSIEYEIIDNPDYSPLYLSPAKKKSGRMIFKLTLFDKQKIQ